MIRMMSPKHLRKQHDSPSLVAQSIPYFSRRLALWLTQACISNKPASRVMRYLTGDPRFGGFSADETTCKPPSRHRNSPKLALAPLLAAVDLVNHVRVSLRDLPPYA